MTPICHRTRGPSYGPGNSDGPSVQSIDALAYEGDLCIGSRCAMWVPETSSLVVHEARPSPRGEGETENPGLRKPTGRGLCAENVRAVPWDDPAKEPT